MGIRESNKEERNKASELENSTMAASASNSSSSEEEITLTVKWSGKEYTVRVCGDDSVAELKRRICELTNVLPKRQKLLYPKVGSKLADDSLLLSQLPLKSSLKMTMIGFDSLSSFFFCIKRLSIRFLLFDSRLDFVFFFFQTYLIPLFEKSACDFCL